LRGKGGSTQKRKRGELIFHSEKTEEEKIMGMGGREKKEKNYEELREKKSPVDRAQKKKRTPQKGCFYVLGEEADEERSQSLASKKKRVGKASRGGTNDFASGENDIHSGGS